MRLMKKCEICGKEFIADRRNAKYCGKVCRKIANNETIEKYLRTKEAAEEATKRESKAKKTPLWKVNEEARKAGLTYGQYQAMLFKAQQLKPVSIG